MAENAADTPAGSALPLPERAFAASTHRRMVATVPEAIRPPATIPSPGT